MGSANNQKYPIFAAIQKMAFAANLLIVKAIVARKSRFT
jgi:hypothetical protein